MESCYGAINIRQTVSWIRHALVRKYPEKSVTLCLLVLSADTICWQFQTGQKFRIWTQIILNSGSILDGNFEKLMRACIYNIDNTDIEIGVPSVYLHLPTLIVWHT